MRTSRRKPFWIHAVEPSLALPIASVVHCFPSVPVFQWLLVSYVFLLCILNILMISYVSSCCPLGFGHENSPRNRFETPGGPVYRKPPGRRRERPKRPLKGQGTEKNSAVPKPRSGKAAKKPLTRPGSADSKMLFIRKWLSTWLLQSHMYTYVTCRICQIEEDFKAVESCGIAAVS